MSTFLAWVNAFVWTNALEAPVCAVVLRHVPGRWWQPLALGLACNLATHPLFTAWQFCYLPSPATICAAEALVALVEGVLCGAWLAHGARCPRPWRVGLTVGVASNACSYGLALLARAL